MTIREALNREISTRTLIRSTLAVVIGIAVLISLRFLLQTAGKKEPSVVEATSSRVIGAWRGDDGTYIEIRPDGSFGTANWPDWNGDNSAGQDTEHGGKWEVQFVGPDSPEVITLSFSSTGGEEIDLPSQVDVVKMKSHSLGLCVDVDPDNPCSFGILKKVNGKD